MEFHVSSLTGNKFMMADVDRLSSNHIDNHIAR